MYWDTDLWYNGHMNTIPTLLLKAQRVQCILHKEDLLIFAYKPENGVISKFRQYEGKTIRIDLEDETGEWTTGAKWTIDKFQQDDGSTAFNLILVTPQ